MGGSLTLLNRKKQTLSIFGKSLLLISGLRAYYADLRRAVSISNKGLPFAGQSLAYQQEYRTA